jgi:phosphatidylglycerol---prolipoprotein diacylglyceryl transferase
MLDSHFHPEHWGVYPFIHLGNFIFSSYSFFVSLGLLVGILIFYLESRKNKTNNERTFLIAVAAIAGGVLGAKILIWILYFPLIAKNLSNYYLILSGRTVVGGFFGGMLAVILTKKMLKIKGKRGNMFAPAAALGLAIGRIGCFLQGCCYGIATTLPWGINFGDGIHRHPTQIYESLFWLIMFFYLQKKKNEKPKPGELFQLLLVDYFIFRFFLEFIKFEPKIILNLTIYQIIAIIALVYLLRNNIAQIWTKKLHR